LPLLVREDGPAKPRSLRQAVLWLLEEASVPVTAGELARTLGRREKERAIRVLLGRLAREELVVCVGRIAKGDERPHKRNAGLWVAL
jgi:predicted ArsR family transcriptional regulator